MNGFFVGEQEKCYIYRNSILRYDKNEGVEIMYTKEQLINKLNEMNIHYYEMISDINEDASIQLESIEQLFLFIKKHGIDTVFYRFQYMSAEGLQITEDVLDDLNIDDEIIEVMQEDFDEYNLVISKLDFSRPCILSICCLYQSHVICSVEHDYWWGELEYEHPKKKAISMIEARLEDVEKKKDESYQNREELRQQLRKRILEDANFHRCTNIQLRRSYTHKLCNSDKSIEGLFYTPNYGLYDINIGTFIEEVWREYKANL